MRLKQSLRLAEASSVFTKAGGLHPEVIAGSRVIIPGQRLGNPDLIKHLTRDGSSIADWAKYSTGQFVRPGGGHFEVHFYMNSVTKAIDYGYDFKAILLP